MRTGSTLLGGRKASRAVFASVCATLVSSLALAAEPAENLALKMSGALQVPVAAERTAQPIQAWQPTQALQPAQAAQPAQPAQIAYVVPPSMRDYRIGADDLLEIQVFGVEQLTRTVRVNTRGQVSLPLIGTLMVGGLTAQQAESMVVMKLAESYLQDPQVSLFIKEYTSQRVTVEGAVAKPGVYPLRGPTTLLQTLAVAGGQGSLGDMHEVMLFRPTPAGQRETLVYDVERIRSGELDDPTVMNEDLIVVKRVKGRVLFRDSIMSDIINTLNPFRWAP
jgi:polysaccharide export outer membrane protein